MDEDIILESQRDRLSLDAASEDRESKEEPEVLEETKIESILIDPIRMSESSLSTGLRRRTRAPPAPSVVPHVPLFSCSPPSIPPPPSSSSYFRSSFGTNTVPPPPIIVPYRPSYTHPLRSATTHPSEVSAVSPPIAPPIDPPIVPSTISTSSTSARSPIIDISSLVPPRASSSLNPTTISSSSLDSSVADNVSERSFTRRSSRNITEQRSSSSYIISY